MQLQKGKITTSTEKIIMQLEKGKSKRLPLEPEMNLKPGPL